MIYSPKGEDIGNKNVCIANIIKEQIITSEEKQQEISKPVNIIQAFVTSI